MAKLEVGMNVSTNYNSGPYVIVKISGPFCSCRLENCFDNNCQNNRINYSYECIGDGTKFETNEKFYLNYYDRFGNSTYCQNKIIINRSENVQLTMF
jgi:hypothetical protein